MLNSDFSIEIIEQHIGDENLNSISARDLHTQLEVKSRFNDWIKNRIKKFGFVENEDFIAITKSFTTIQNNKSYYRDLILTLKTASIIVQKTSHNSLSAEIYKSISLFLNKEVVIREVQRKEIEFFTALQTVLNVMNIEVETQFKVLNYRIDGYIKEYNIAIEYDEFHHKFNTNHKQDLQREKEIKKYIKCSFVRLEEEKEHFKNIGIVVDAIFKKKPSENIL